MSDQLVRFTGSARHALTLAEKEARRLGQRYIGTEHLLIGVMREDLGLAATALLNLGLDPDTLANAVQHRSPASTAMQTGVNLTLSPGGKSVLRKALRQARLRGESLVGTERLLLTLIEQREGTAARLLISMGVEPEHIRQEVMRLSGEAPISLSASPDTPRFVFKERYQIEDVLGVGQLSTVYRARDLAFQDVVRWVAVKEMTLPADDPISRQHAARNFRREAELLATLRHPFIPRFFDFFVYESRFYLVMECVSGVDMGTLLSEMKDPPPLRSVVKWAYQLCDVLTYLHHHQPEPIIFRDLKPSNIMLDEAENIRLIDFNIAKAFEVGTPGSRVGTVGYAPPEQYHGDASPQGDIYALGATLHHLLTGHDPRIEPPFSFEDRPIHLYNQGVPDEVEQVIYTALSYEKESRYASAQAMKQALTSAAQSLPPL
jgi:tRNA A-37 threonylcarbamoyl transferase component Bud32